MIKNIIVTITIFLTSQLCLKADILIRGRLITEGNKPISYANIGILNMPVGTTSQENGEFEISIPDEHIHENLIFSSLGFERTSIPIAELKGNQFIEIRLKEKPIYLNEIKISEKRLKLKKSLTGPSPSGNELCNFNSRERKGGAVMAVLIDPKPDKYIIKNVRLNIARNTLDKAKLRVRFFNVNDTTILPDNDLVQENIMVDCSIEQGWLMIDLEDYQIQFDLDKFFIGIELIEDLEVRKLQDIEDSLRRVHYKKLYDKGAKGIQQITKTVNGTEKITGYIARNKGAQALTMSLKEAGVKPSPRINFKISSKAARKFPCYSKAASFDKWKIQPFALVAKVLIEYEK